MKFHDTTGILNWQRNFRNLVRKLVGNGFTWSTHLANTKKKFYPKDFLYWRKKKLFFSNKKLFFKWKKNFYHPFERVTLTWATHLTHQKEGLSTQKVFYSYLRNQFFMPEKKSFILSWKISCTCSEKKTKKKNKSSKWK